MQVKNGMIYWQTGEDIQLTPYFNTREFECPEPDETNTHCINMELVSLLHIIRTEYGAPIKVTSAYRTPAYQQKLRQAGYNTASGKSQHELGNAADIKPARTPSGLDLIRLDNIIAPLVKAVGRAPGWWHIDTRRDKFRRWKYDK